MDINLTGLIITLIIAICAWYANDKLNTISILKTIIQVVIVLVSIYYLWNFLGISNHYIHLN
jgi:hypothetical protein